MAALYSELAAKQVQARIQKNLAAPGPGKMEYDSDEETEGGTWEHKVSGAQSEGIFHRKYCYCYLLFLQNNPYSFSTKLATPAQHWCSKCDKNNLVAGEAGRDGQDPDRGGEAD